MSLGRRAAASRIAGGLLCGVVLSAAARAAAAQQVEPAAMRTASLPLEREGGLPSLELRVPYGTMVVEGWERPRVEIELRVDPRFRDRFDEPPSLHPGLSTEEGVVRLALDDNPVPVELRVRAPRDLDLHLASENGGALTVRGIRGRIRAETSNAGVRLEDVAGAAAVATSNGSIRASFTRIDPDTPLSFLTSNGEVHILLPADPDLELSIETDRDEIEIGFPLEPSSRPLPPGRVQGRIGRGGPLLRVWTSNAGVRIAPRGAKE